MHAESVEIAPAKRQQVVSPPVDEGANPIGERLPEIGKDCRRRAHGRQPVPAGEPRIYTTRNFSRFSDFSGGAIADLIFGGWVNFSRFSDFSRGSVAILNFCRAGILPLQGPIHWGLAACHRISV
jgi:hypothetical protein